MATKVEGSTWKGIWKDGSTTHTRYFRCTVYYTTDSSDPRYVKVSVTSTKLQLIKDGGCTFVQGSNKRVIVKTSSPVYSGSSSFTNSTDVLFSFSNGKEIQVGTGGTFYLKRGESAYTAVINFEGSKSPNNSSAAWHGFSTGSFKVSVPALSSYNVSYSGADIVPDSQTKYYGQNLNLSLDIPSKAGYDFLGWATSEDGEVVYSPGGVYSNNSSVVLYAVWDFSSSWESSVINIPTASGVVTLPLVYRCIIYNDKPIVVSAFIDDE